MKGKNFSLTIWIIVAMLLGAALGLIMHHFASKENIDVFAKNIKLLSTIFIRLVQMIIAPLVFTTLVVGIAKMGNIRTVGRVGGKAMLWFISASFISLLLGLLLVNFFQPGVGVDLGTGDIEGASELIKGQQGFSVQKFIEHLVPKSIIEAMASNEILQIVVFSLFFGLALTHFGEKGTPVIKALDLSAHVILKVVEYVMYFAPIGVFGSISAIFAKKGASIIETYAKYIGSFYVGLIVLWLLLLVVGYILLKNTLPHLLLRIKNPLLIAFSTTSSEAVFPKLTEELERFGCKKSIVNFVLPLGYSFNLDGSMMYMTFAGIFIAQINNIPMDIATQFTMLLVFMITSKGIAGVPRASLIVVTATCAMFKLPPESIAFILPIDHFCDMGRSMTNVLGNALATSVVDKWERAENQQD